MSSEELGSFFKAFNETYSLFLPQLFIGTAIIVTIPIVVFIARQLWRVVKWALRWLVYLMKDERKKKKEDYTAHYDELLGIEPTWWQRFRGRLLPLLEALIDDDQAKPSTAIDYDQLMPWDRETLKSEMYRGARPWDECLMRLKESEWVASPMGQATRGHRAQQPGNERGQDETRR